MKNLSITLLIKLIILISNFTISQNPTVVIPGSDFYIGKLDLAYGYDWNSLRIGKTSSGWVYRGIVTWNNIRTYIPLNVEILSAEFEITWIGNGLETISIEYYFFDYSGNLTDNWQRIEDGELIGVRPATDENYQFNQISNLLQDIVNNNGSDVIRIGIKNQSEQTYLDYVDYGYNVNLKVIYKNVIVNQIDDSGNTFGKVGKWVDNSWGFVNVPFNLEMQDGSNLGLKSDQEFKQETYQKYWLWKQNSDVIISNPYLFTIQSGYNELISTFRESYSGVTIKNALEGTDITGGTLFFYDPWLIDYPDTAFPNPQGGYYNRNRGMDAPPKQRSSPFYPDDTTNYNGDVYKGVFLNQLISSGTYYNVWAGDQQINLGSPLGIRNFYFHNWTATGADLQPFGAGNQSAVVFTSGNAVVQANLKGQGLSNLAEAYTNNSQRKAVRLENSNVLLSAYKSLDNKVWLEQSNDNGANWFFKNMPFDNDPVNEYSTTSIDYIPDLGGSHPFAAVVHNLIKLTIVRSNAGVAYYTAYLDFNWDSSPNLTLPITPVVAATSSRILVVSTGGMNQSGQAGLTYHYGTLYYSAPGQFNVTWTDGHLSPLYKIIPGTNQYSKNVSVVADKNTSNVFHITWQEVNSIKYCKATGSGNNLTFSAVETVSASSPYSSNLYPSISLANGNPVISWTGSGKLVSEKISGKENFERTTSKAVIRRKGTTWGDFQLAGNNVNFTNNNSVSSTQEKTVIVWSEGTTNPQSKWLKRTGSDYSGPCNLSHSGIEAQVISGSDYQYMTSMVFNNNQLPYYFTKSTTNFYPECSQGGGLEKITNLSDSVVTYGRTGITSINDISFVFNVGDVIVGDSIVRFIEKPDTLVYSTYEDLNQFTRTEDFQLNSSSQFYFSNLYFVRNIEQADSSLSENDNVNFKVELVNSITGQVAGVFDNITYNKNNLEKYDNISYQVNCSGIQPGEYYLRLVTTVNGQAEYTLANIINETVNLDKRHFQIINYDGSEMPVTYSLEQNYPNPFNPSTTIRYQLPQDGMVTLKVYDILGSEVATLVNEQKSAGRYEVNFDASRLASGVYIYKITSGSYVSSKKMLLVK